jgi:hypothetical protein
VYSARPDTVAVTIYREDLALITETRTVSLPAGPVTVVVQGVVESLLPQSVVITGAERPLAESNFDFDRLTPLSLLEGSVGDRDAHAHEPGGRHRHACACDDSLGCGRRGAADR